MWKWFERRHDEANEYGMQQEYCIGCIRDDLDWFYEFRSVPADDDGQANHSENSRIGICKRNDTEDIIQEKNAAAAAETAVGYLSSETPLSHSKTPSMK